MQVQGVQGRCWPSSPLGAPGWVQLLTAPIETFTAHTVQKGCAVLRGQKVLQTNAALAALAALAAADHRLPAAIFVLKKPC